MNNATTESTTNGKEINGDGLLVGTDDHGEQTHQATFSPRFDIWEGDSELILYGDLPGVDAESLSIEYENRQLFIHGRVTRGTETSSFLCSEYAIGDFHRTFTVGERINGDGINATMRDGVLTIHLPKVEDAKPRRIEVKTH